MFYYVYGSDHNKESLDTLMYGMTLSDFFTHRTYIEIQHELERAMEKDSKEQADRERNSGKQR
ncbi:MAG: hypothetical protein GOVbin4162_29 [Prokaryotic dsDNA virus sp.]|nr:MAG: hypothetical protein GOVbin4162_29 [Prokaryotic dsDNA virus sp.]|tara:strand:- start:2528 stop:2716 length:189 start_codon:yes stop_codon:yes gene_type:complete